MRHGRMLKSSNDFINFPVRGSYVPVMFYYTTVKLGSLPREFHVQIDTGSEFFIQLNSFDPKTSSTASNLSCSDQRCSIAPQALDQPTCSAHDNQCNFFQKYGDQTKPVMATVIRFSQGNVSVISQLSALGVAPKAFAHCLKGDETGGGTFFLGTVDEPSIAYTKIDPSEYLLHISVNGDIVSNISGFFSTPSERKTIIDSGTTYASIETIYIDSFIEAMTMTIMVIFCLRGIVGMQIKSHVVNTLGFDVFPQVGFHFDGGASMVLEPKDYLINDTTIDDDQAWCIAFQEGDATILGDLFLKDKIVAYDLDGQRIGWAKYDCSKAVKVTASTSSGTETVTIQPPITPSSSTNATSPIS
ncbi:hypothetical protein UlMin_007488 [Ulmus minor]